MSKKSHLRARSATVRQCHLARRGCLCDVSQPPPDVSPGGEERRQPACQPVHQPVNRLVPSKVKVSTRRGLLSTGPGHIYTRPPTRPGPHLCLGTSPSGAPVSTGLSPVWLPSTGPIVSTSLSTGPLLAGRVNRASRACHRSTGPRRDTVDRTRRVAVNRPLS